MKLGTLNIENFLTIGEAKINLADRGLVLIQGVNEDDSSASSNGAGKSSIVDALCWALFGVTARGETGDKVVNRTIGKGCKVGVNVHDGDDIFQIVRHRKHKTGKNGVTLHVMHGHGGAVTDLTQGTDKLTQEKIQEILGCSYDVFCAAVYAGQDSMPDLPGMTDKFLKTLVEEAAGVTVLESAYEEARSRMTARRVEIETLTTQKERLDDQIRHVRDTIADTALREGEWEKERKIDISRAEGLAAGYDEKASELRDAIERNNPKKLSDDLTKVQAKLASVDGERTEEKRLADVQSDAERLVTGLKTRLEMIKQRYAKEKAAIAATGELVGSPCGECGKAYCEHDIADAKRIATEKAQATAREYATIKSEAESALKSLQSARKALSKHRASMTDVSKFAALSDALNAKLRATGELTAQRRRELDLAQDERDRVEKMKKARNAYTEQREREEANLAKLTEKRAELDTTMAEALAAYQLSEAVVKVFSPSGVRAHILDEVTPFLNEQTAKYLGTLSDGNISATWSTLIKNAKGELREKFSIEVEHAEGGESFGVISGGEKRKVRIATSLALQDLVSRRAAKPIDLFIGDEIDNALDDAGLERLTMILEEKAHERGSVFIVSHSDLKDWISNVVTVTKRGKKSFITEEIV